MKLAIVSETFPPEVNGVAMTFGTIAREFVARGHSVTVYRPARTKEREESVDAGFRVRTMPGCAIPGYGLLRFGWPAGGALRREWKRDRPDLVHVVTEGPLGASAVGAARSLGLPVTSSFHTNFHQYAGDYRLGWLRRLVLAWLRRVHNRTLRTFAPTQEICGELRALGFRNLSVLARGVDTRVFHPGRRCRELRASWGAGERDLVVLHVGRMAPEKNYPLLFRVYDAMRRAEPRLQCVLAGEGPLRKKLEQDHPECRFEGFLSRHELGRYYASADIYIHASQKETYGNVLVEAMASGMAVAGFDYAAARLLVRDGLSGLTVPCEEPGALVRAGLKLASDPALRLRLGAGAVDAVAELSWTSVVVRFEEELASLAGGRRA